MKIIGSLFWDYTPICIIIPKLHTHLQYIEKRNMNKEFVLKVREFLIQKSKRENIKVCETSIEATKFVEDLEKKNIIEHSQI